MKRRNLSVRAWLIGLGAAVALPLLLVLSWVFATRLRREKNEARNIALRTAKAAAAQITSQHATSVAFLKRMAQRGGVTCDPLLAISDFLPPGSNLLFYDRNGSLVCSANPRQQNAAGQLLIRITEPVAGDRDTVHGTLVLI